MCTNSSNKVLIIGRVSKNIGGNATGGIAKHIEGLALSLSKRGVKPFIWDFTLQKSMDIGTTIIYGATYLNKLISLFHSFFIVNLWFSKTYKNLTLRDKFIVGIQTYQIKRIINKHNFDTVHIHSLNRPVTGFLRTCFPNLNIVITDHGFWQKINMEGRKREKQIINKILDNIGMSNKIIVISDFSIEKFKEFGLPLGKVKKISNPILASNIPITPKTKKENIILFNGFNESLRIKNLPKLLEAIDKSEILKRDFKLVAIVNNKAKEFLERRNFQFEVEILGVQSWGELVNLYNRSKVLVVPSKSESFGLVYMEALAVGTPVIGFHKTIEEFQKTLQVDIGETFDNDSEKAEDLALKIEKVVSKTYEKEFIRERVVKNYDWENNIEHFINIYFEEYNWIRS